MSPGDMDGSVDLDADGMDIDTELSLGLSPTVSDNPVEIVSDFSGGTVTGTIDMHVNVAANFTPAAVELYANGSLAPGTVEVISPASHSVPFSFDTTAIDNGLVSLTPVVTMAMSTAEGTENVRVVGKPCLVVVQNYLTFAPIFDGTEFQLGWRDHFGGRMPLQAYSSVGSFEYEISIQNPDAAEVAHFGPSSSVYDAYLGVSYISEEWDLTSGGVPQTDDHFQVTVTAYFPTKSAPQRVATAIKLSKRGASLVNWPPYAGWIIAYQDWAKSFVNPNANNRDMLWEAIDNLATVEYEFAINSTDPVVPPPAGYEEPTANAFWMQYGRDVTQSDRDNDWAELKGFVIDGRWRNMYVNAHADSFSLGCDFDNADLSKDPVTTPSSQAFMNTAYVRAVLGTGDPIVPATRPYRFVWLDGCLTATGPWPESFDISPNKLCNLRTYQDSQGGFVQRPCGFIGWNWKIVWSTFNWDSIQGKYVYGQVCQGFAEFRSVFFQKLAEGATFSQARYQAARVANQYPFQKVKRWDKGFVQFGWSGLDLESYNDKTSTQ